jgi:hypothetical protein
LPALVKAITTNRYAAEAAFARGKAASTAADPPRLSAGRAFPVSPNRWRSLSPHRHRRAFPTRSPAGHTVRFAYETPAATLLIDLIGQGCACAAWFRSNAAHNPERLEPCQTPRETPQVETPRPGVSTRPQTPAHPFAQPTPRRPRQRRLGSSRARLPAARVLRPARPAARDASGQLVHSTLSKTSTRAACGYRPAQGLSMRPLLHGFGLASAGLPGARFGACHTELASQGPTSDALVTGRQPRLSPGPPSDQYRFHRHLVKDSGFHDTERLEPASSPPRALCFSPRASTRRSLSLSFRPRLPASG